MMRMVLAGVIITSCVPLYEHRRTQRYALFHEPNGPRTKHCEGPDAYYCFTKHRVMGWKLQQISGYRSSADLRTSSQPLTQDQVFEIMALEGQ